MRERRWLPGANRAASKPGPELSSPSWLTTLCPLASSALAQTGRWTWSGCTFKSGEKMADLSPFFQAVPNPAVYLGDICTPPIILSSPRDPYLSSATLFPGKSDMHARASLCEPEVPLRSARASGWFISQGVVNLPSHIRKLPSDGAKRPSEKAPNLHSY